MEISVLNKDFVTRSLTAFVALGVTGLSLYFNIFNYLTLLILFGLLYEWSHLLHKKNNLESTTIKEASTIQNVAPVIKTPPHSYVEDKGKDIHERYLTFMPYLFTIFAAMFAIFSEQTTATWLGFSKFFYFIGLFYIFNPKTLTLNSGAFVITYGTMCLLTLMHVFSWHYLAALCIVIWTNDICAYLGGRMLQGPKLAPTISPSKTWSGLACGLVMATIIGGFAIEKLTAIPHAFFLSFAIALIGNLGDLLESKIKRIYHVKDSGTILPGHGGLLDRLDSLLTVGFVGGLLLFINHFYSIPFVSHFVNIT